MHFTGTPGDAGNFLGHQAVEKRHMRKQCFDIDALMVSVHAGIRKDRRGVISLSRAMVAFVAL